MKFRPCIDLHDGQVKQIVGSSLSDTDRAGLKTTFASELSPAHYAELYRRDRLFGGHVIMLGPGNEEAGRKALAAFPGGLQIGGGITADNAASWLEQGASHVIVTSHVFKDGKINDDRLRALTEKIGKKHLVLDLSCRRKGGSYFIVTDRWQNFTSITISEQTLGYFAGYCDEFLVHAVDVEGKCSGIEEKLAVILGRYAPIPTTYAGGITHLADLKRLKELGGGRLDATIGSALDIFGGSGITYAEAVAFHRRENP
ncbi:MAG: phosphoribosylformimino-5-aminoimidazole carboxamide ribotide isomerase [Deltaproteobacteria bacterium]